MTRARTVRHQRLACRSALAALAVGCAVMLTSCTSYLTVTQLEAVPESHLLYPGAVVIQVSTQPQVPGGIDTSAIDGYVATQFRTTASRAELLAWYQQQLAARGWTYHGTQFQPAPIPDLYWWIRSVSPQFPLGREWFYLGETGPDLHSYIKYIANDR